MRETTRDAADLIGEVYNQRKQPHGRPEKSSQSEDFSGKTCRAVADLASKIEPVETDEIRVEPGSNGGYFIEAGRRRFRFPDVEDPIEVARLLLDIVEGDAEDRR